MASKNKLRDDFLNQRGMFAPTRGTPESENAQKVASAAAYRVSNPGASLVDSYAATGAFNGYGSQGSMSPESAEFIPIEALGEINVAGLIDEMAGINRETTKENFGIAQEMGRTVAGNAFTDFEAFLDKILPEADGLTRSVARTAQEFIETGLPRAVMGNAILRDSQMFATTGTRGDVAVRRGLANEAARDTAGVQYGVGLAQDLVNQARATALPFAQLGAEATQANLGLLTDLTTITPAQRIATAFDERNYQTQVAMFNASGSADMSRFNAGQANQMSIAGAQLAMQQQMYQAQLAAQRAQAKAAERAGLFSLLGTGLGLGASLLLPGGGTAANLLLGASVGGGVGQIAGGLSTGNYGLASQGVATGLTGLGAYQAWQTQQSMVAQAQAAMGQLSTILPYYGNTGSPMWRSPSGSFGGYPYNIGGYPYNIGGYPYNIGGYPYNIGGYPYNIGGYRMTNGGMVGPGGYPVSTPPLIPSYP